MKKMLPIPPWFANMHARPAYYRPCKLQSGKQGMQDRLVGPPLWWCLLKLKFNGQFSWLNAVTLSVSKPLAGLKPKTVVSACI